MGVTSIAWIYLLVMCSCKVIAKGKHGNERWNGLGKDLMDKLENGKGVAAIASYKDYFVLACRGMQVLHDESGNITYPQHGQTYPKNEECNWRIMAEPNKIIEMRIDWVDIYDDGQCDAMECCNAHLRIRDGYANDAVTLATLCGRVHGDRQAYTVESGSADIHFHSGESKRRGSGFHLSYRVIERLHRSVDNPACDGQPQILTSNHGEITSPGFSAGSNYPHGADCTWRIESPTGMGIQLRITTVQIEKEISCLYDALNVMDGETSFGPYCGKPQVPIIINSMSQAISIHFRTDSSVNDRGFRASWTFTATEDGGMKQYPGCGGTAAHLVEEEGSFMSPGFVDGKYPNGLKCSWRVEIPNKEKRARVHFASFELEGPNDACRYDRVVIYDGGDITARVLGRYCGDMMPGDLTATGNTMLITFVSDSSLSFRGFRAQYAAKTSDLGPTQPEMCGMPEIAVKLSRIVGGDTAAPGSWPWQVRIQYRALNWGHWCGGSMLANSWVISAAHCVYFNNADETDFRVVVGDHSADSQQPNEAIINIKRMIIHEDYKSDTNENDIVLFELERPVAWTRDIKPVCLPATDPSPNELCITTGWGDTRGTADNTYLQQVFVPIVDLGQCMTWYSGTSVVTDVMLCAGYPEGQKDSCQGDSGGPLVCKTQGGPYVLQGLTSFGAGCAVPEKPGVYTRVTRFVDWIENHTGVAPVA